MKGIAAVAGSLRSEEGRVAVHLLHVHVAEDQVGQLLAGPVNAHHAVLGFEDIIALLGERDVHHLAQPFFVVYDQDSFHLLPAVADSLPRPGRRGARGVSNRANQARPLHSDLTLSPKLSATSALPCYGCPAEAAGTYDAMCGSSVPTGIRSRASLPAQGHTEAIPLPMSPFVRSAPPLATQSRPRSGGERG